MDADQSDHAVIIASLTAMLEAKKSWIDGARVDIEALEAERDSLRDAISRLSDNAVVRSAIGDAMRQTGALGCGCCVQYPVETCDCGKTLEELDYATCGKCGTYPWSRFDRAGVLADVALAVVVGELRSTWGGV